jgi:hypothetical protein
MTDALLILTPDGRSLDRDLVFADDAGGARRLEVDVPTLQGGIIMRAEPGAAASLAASGFTVKELPDVNLLRVGGYEIDVEQGPPRLPRALRLTRDRRAAWSHYLVQLVGPPLPEFVADVREAGLEVIDRIDRYGLFATGSPEAADRVAELACVSWVGAFEPAYRIAPSLRDRRGRGRVGVGVFPASDVEEVAGFIREAGGEIETVEAPDLGDLRSGRSDRTGLVVCEIDLGTSLNEVANHPSVRFIDSYEPFIDDDERASQIVAESLDTTPPPGTAPVVGYQNRLTNLGIDGTGVTIAIIDRGIDNHNNATLHQDLRGRLAFFADQTGGTTTVDVNGHGTHVAGIAAGNGATGDTDPQGFTLGLGVAPGANVGSINYLQASPQPTVDSVLRVAATNGSEVANNSYGTAAPQGYSARCVNVDQRVRDPNPAAAGFERMAIVYSAGNAGGLPGSLTGPHEAKNVIVVGNSLTFRPGEGFAVDDIRGISDSSSRGPAADGRILPHVMAPGTDIVSARSTQDSNPGTPGVQRPYTTYVDTAGTAHANHAQIGGTSMSAPAVSGLCALLIEWWRDRTGTEPSAAMLKALVINGAEDMAGGPNWKRLIVPGVQAWTAAGANWQLTGLGFVPAQVWGWTNAAGSLTQYTQRASVAQITGANQFFYNAGTDTITVRTGNGQSPDRPTRNAAGNPQPWARVRALDTNPVGAIPNNDQGWGRASLENIVLTSPDSDRGPRIFSDQRVAFTANGQQHQIRVVPVDTTRPMRITVCWTDPPAAANPPGATLVNDLDLVVDEIATGATYRGNNFANGFSTPGGAADNLHNTECVYIQNPSGEYDVRVVAAGITTDARTFTLGSPWQDYAIVIDNAQVPAADPVSVVPVLDRSGSMVWSGYVDVTRTSSKAFIDLLNVDDAVGVVSFGSSADVEYPPGASPEVRTIDGTGVRSDARDAVDGITFGGSTHMGPGITAGRDLLAAAAGSKAIVLMSDGYDNGSPNALTAAAGLPADVPLYTCAMGPASDQTLLEQLASATSGRYYYMPTIDDLFEIYNWIRGRVTGTGVVANEQSAASFSRIGAYIDETVSRAVFSVAWADESVAYVPRDPRRPEEVSVRLRTPQGKLVHPRSSLMRVVTGKGMVGFDLHDPVPGQWYMEVATERPGHLPYTAAAHVSSDVTVDLEIEPRTLIRGRPFTLAVAAFEGGRAIDRIAARACIERPRIGLENLLRAFRSQLRNLRPVRRSGGDNIPDQFGYALALLRWLEKQGDREFLGTVVDCFDLGAPGSSSTGGGRPTTPTIPGGGGIVVGGGGTVVGGGGGVVVMPGTGGSLGRIALPSGARFPGFPLPRPPAPLPVPPIRLPELIPFPERLRLNWPELLAGLGGTTLSGTYHATAEPGSYNITVEVNGTLPSDGSPFRRKEFVSVRVL